MKVLIVDGDAASRDWLRSALSTSDQVEIVGEAASGEEAVRLVEELAPEIVFMDVRLPGITGIEAAKQVLSQAPDTKIILFTVDESRAALADATRAGVSGYLLKDVSASELIQAGKLALEGKAAIEEAQYVDTRPNTPLSRRESEILLMVANGATTREVVHKLGISPHTVKTHVERIIEKLRRSGEA